MNTSLRLTVEQFRSLDIRQMARKGALIPGYSGRWGWWQDGELIAELRYRTDNKHLVVTHTVGNRPFSYRIWIERTPCTYGGARPWFLCPVTACGRRVAKLYLGRVLACRHCHQLAYAAQTLSKAQRPIFRAQQYRVQRGLDPDYEQQPASRVPRQKHMHYATYRDMVLRLARYDNAAVAARAPSFLRLMRRCERAGL